MFGVLPIVALAVAAPVPVLPGEFPAGRPELLVKGRAYFLHALPPAQPPWKPLPPPWREFSRTIPDGLVLLHTSRATGEMKVLAAGRTTVSVFDGTNVPQVSHSRTRIVGVAADEATWEERAAGSRRWR